MFVLCLLFVDCLLLSVAVCLVLLFFVGRCLLFVVRCVLSVVRCAVFVFLFVCFVCCLLVVVFVD